MDLILQKTAMKWNGMNYKKEKKMEEKLKILKAQKTKLIKKSTKLVQEFIEVQDKLNEIEQKIKEMEVK